MIEGAVQLLLIDNNPDDNIRMLQALRRRKLANWIQVVSSASEALDFIFRTGAYRERSTDNPGLILLNLELPKASGLEFLRRIKEDPTTQSIPVVVLTASHDERDIVESYRLGVNSYVVKPIDGNEMVAAVQHLAYYWLILNQPPGRESRV